MGDYQLPKLVLQPLVENAIYHGIKEMDRPGMIRVTSEIREEEVVLTIYDNGRGFALSESTDQTLLRLGGVGLKNVDQRLHLQFGEAIIWRLILRPIAIRNHSLFAPSVRQ